MGSRLDHPAGKSIKKNGDEGRVYTRVRRNLLERKKGGALELVLWEDGDEWQ